MANEFKVKRGLVVDGTGTVVDVQGTQGQLFSITDSLTGDLFSVSDVSGIPILNVNSSGIVTIDGSLQLADNDKIQIGDAQDLELYHDGSNSYIKDNGTGSFIINANGSNRFFVGSDVGVLSGTDFFIEAGRKLLLDGAGGHTYIEEESDSKLKFYVGGSERLNITNTVAFFLGDVTTTDSVTVGNRAVTSSTTNYENVLRVKGKNNYSDGTTWYGTYGQILLHSDTNMTGTARRYLITNAYNNRDFAIVRSVDGNTDPVVNSTSTGVNSGSADFVIDYTGAATFASTISASNFSGSSSGANTGDQTLPTASSLGAVTISGTQTITGVKTFNPAVSLAATLSSGKYSNITIQGKKQHRFLITGQIDHTVELTCPSYFSSMVTITAHQTNGGAENNLYIRGLWTNNHTTHHWRQIENIGGLSGSSFTITNGQNGSTTNSGKLTISHNYSSASFAELVITVEEHYGTMGNHAITAGNP